MKRIALALAAVLFASSVYATPTPTGSGVQQSGSVTAGHYAIWAGKDQVQDGGAPFVQTYPLAGVAVSTGSAWTTSLQVGTSGATLGLLNGNNTYGGNNIFTNPIAGSVTGNAATVTTNANLTGAITSSGNATSLGSFSSAALSAALSDETGTGSAVFSVSPTFTGTVSGASATWSATDTALNFAATGTGANVVPIGTTGQAPTAANGMVRYDSTLNRVRVAISNAWQSVFTTADVIPVANGGTGQVNGLVFNSTGAAAANTTAIQAALTAGGHVTIDCPPSSIVWVNSTLLVSSNTWWDIRESCTIKETAGTYLPVLENFEYQQPWTTEYINSGLIASGPQSVIWSGNTPNWIATHAYVQGNYAVANGNIYWENAASCTSAGSGGPSGNSGTSTGPTGTTGAAITDNTCSWYYVTTNLNPNASQLAATIYYPSSGIAAGNFVTITPQPDGNTTNVWTGSQTAHTRGGPSDTAYFGTFFVYGVNDSNYITVMLNRLPVAAFSGIPMNMQPSDHDIVITGGGTLDYNSANTTPPTIQWNGDVANFSSIDRFQMFNLYMENAVNHRVNLNGMNDFDVYHLEGRNNSASDFIHVYSSVHGHVHNMHCHAVDDCIAVQTQEPSAFYNQIWLAGDTLDVSVDHITSDTGFSVSIYPTDPNLTMDDIVVDTANVNPVAGSGTTLFPTINISGITGGGTASSIGSLTIKNIDHRAANVSAVAATNGIINIHNLVLDTVNLDDAASQQGSVLLAGSTNTGTIDNLTVRNLRYITTSGGNAFQFGAGTVNTFNIIGGYVSSPNGNVISNTGATLNVVSIDGVQDSSSGGYLLNQSGGSTAEFNVSHSNLANLAYIYSSSTSNSVSINLRDNITTSVNEGLGIGGGTANVVSASGNSFFNMGNGLVRYNATATVSLYSGGNTLTGTSVYWAFPVGTDTASSYGWDIRCDVTKMTRTTGEFCYNTNTSPGSGTLTTSGLVGNQGTSSNSWFLLSNPSGQQY